MGVVYRAESAPSCMYNRQGRGHPGSPAPWLDAAAEEYITRTLLSNSSSAPAWVLYRRQNSNGVVQISAISSICPCAPAPQIKHVRRSGLAHIADNPSGLTTTGTTVLFQSS